MKFLFKKEKAIIDKIEKYFKQVERCRDEFRKCVEILIKEKHSKKHTNMITKVHSEESVADDLRREIEVELYQKALIPESRGDVLGLIETIDRIPGNFESICYQICLQQVEVPEKIIDELFALVDTNIESFDILRKVTMGFFYNKDVIEELRRIDKKESESDVLERKIIEKIFKMKIDLAEKILLKDIVINIGDISDFAERAGDRLSLAIVKRQV